MPKDVFGSMAPGRLLNRNDLQARNAPFIAPGIQPSDYTTPLSPADEQAFVSWVKQNHVGYDLHQRLASTRHGGAQDYDMRGFWKGLTTGDPHAAEVGIDPNDNRLHYTDYWKTPLHESFSGESKFAGPNAPTWQGDQLVGPDGKTYYDDAAPRGEKLIDPPAVFGSMAPSGGRPTDLMSIVKQMYPMLRDTNFGLVNSPDANSDGNMMESWPVGEAGEPGYQRPAGLPLDQFGVQVFDQNTTPRDIAADVFSHNLVNSDPALKQDYEAFSKTFETPQGKTQLLRDYQWDRQNANESRPMAEWAKTTRIPAYFRGRVFSQWSDEDQKNMYTPEQLGILDRMSARVHGPQK